MKLFAVESFYGVDNFVSVSELSPQGSLSTQRFSIVFLDELCALRGEKISSSFL